MSDLAKLRALLRRAPRSALEIAKVMGVSKPTAYKRIAQLRAQSFNEQVYEITPVRADKPGPAPTLYGLR